MLTVLVVVTVVLTVTVLSSSRLREAVGWRLSNVVSSGPDEGAVLHSPRGHRTVESVMAVLGPEMSRRWRERFAALGLDWPPKSITLLAFKEEKRLEVWAAHGQRRVHVRDYPIKAASGVAGPKLREGDRQVPEGVYRLVGLNPNSSYHLSMKLNYPNPADQAWARLDGRTNPGGDIFIHGRSASIGCLAMGDPAIEELFVLIRLAGVDNVTVLLVPYDCRIGRPLVRPTESPAWVDDVYAELQHELAGYAR